MKITRLPGLPSLFIAMILATIVVLALAACGQPVPPDKVAYVGYWVGPDMRLAISPSGRVVYERRQGSSSQSLDAPLRRFEGDNFVVGIGPLSTTFIVSVPPRLDDGIWTMTVDQVKLTKKQGQVPDA